MWCIAFIMTFCIGDEMEKMTRCQSFTIYFGWSSPLLEEFAKPKSCVPNLQIFFQLLFLFFDLAAICCCLLANVEGHTHSTPSKCHTLLMVFHLSNSFNTDIVTNSAAILEMKGINVQFYLFCFLFLHTDMAQRFWDISTERLYPSW